MAVSSKSYNIPLNGYRGFCALAVFLYHAGNAGVVSANDLGPFDFVLSSLRYGVELFFMISGFVIAGSLRRQPDLGAFLRDRFIRIYVAWAPSVVVLTAVMWGLALKEFANVSTARATTIFLLNFYLIPPFVPKSLQTAEGLQPYVNPASWSLTYEWVFYFAAGVVTALQHHGQGQGHERALRRVLAWAVGALAAAFVIAFPRALFFVPGLVVFRYASFFERHKALLRMPALSLITFLLAWGATRADKAELTDTMLDWSRDGRIWPAALALLAAVHMFASITLRATSQFKFLETRAFQFLGQISFSFYLWHAPLIFVAKRGVNALIVPHVGVYGGLACLLLGAFALTTTLSWASWALCEVKLASALRAALSPPPRAARETANESANLEIQPAHAE